jgi:hypothetical protein
MNTESEVDVGSKEVFWVSRRYLYTWCAALFFAIILVYHEVSAWITIPLCCLLLATSPDWQTTKALITGNKAIVKDEE